MELFYILRHCECKDGLYLLSLRLDAFSGQYRAKVFWFCGTEGAFLCIYLQPCMSKPDEYLPQFHEVIIQTALCDAQEIIDVCSYKLKGYHRLQHLSMEDVWRTCKTHW